MAVDESVARCSLIAGLIAADDVVTQEEAEFLARAMDRMGLTTDQRSAVLGDVDTMDASFMAATLPPEEKRALLDDLVQAAMADGHLHPSEEQYIRRMAMAMRIAGEVDAYLRRHQ